MTFKDLQRIIEQEQEVEESPAMQHLLRRLRDKQFWLWYYKEGNEKEHTIHFERTNANCCFNHILGLPKKNGEEKPFFNYQKQVFKALFDPTYLNHRAPTPEEDSRYTQLLKDAELIGIC